ncbi:unnamed protein product [marine sediment metagenome]|uniref:Uncharacterized protein n=1 Tax=marine sediment metagenome TaxID=412755 RepID=X1R8Z8_9ZZZZ
MRKMRWTDHSDYISFFEISGGGIRIIKIEEVGPPRKAGKKK